MSGSSSIIEASLDRFDERYGELRLVKPQVEASVCESMRQLGQLVPVVATERDGVLVVVDGFKRLHAARSLELPALEVRLLELSETASLAALYGLNRHGGGISDFEQALVVRELCRGRGMTQPEVAELLGHHKSWVSRRLALLEQLDEQVQSDLRVGLVSSTTARELVRLPRGNQGEVARAIFGAGLTSRDAALLVTLFEGASDRERQTELLSEPSAALERVRGRPPVSAYDHRLSVEDNRLRRAVLGALESQARLARALAGAVAAPWTESRRGALSPLLSQVQEQSLGLVATLGSLLSTSEVTDAGQ